MEENKPPTGIKILGILHIIVGIPLIVFLGFGLYFIALGWGLLKLKTWARTLAMITHIILGLILYTLVSILSLVVPKSELPEHALGMIIFYLGGIILHFGIALYLYTYNVKFAFGLELPSREDRLIDRIKSSIASGKNKQIIGVLWEQCLKAGLVGRDVFYKARPVFYAKFLGLADKLAVTGKTTFARKIYKQIIKGLESRQKIDITDSNLLGKAYFALGRIDVFEHEELSAFSSYKKAKEFNYPLDKDAIILLGNFYAREGNKTEAIETYIEYIRFRTSQVDEDSKRVYSLLESICHIDEKNDTTKLKAAISLNQRVLNANHQLEWAHYYLGLGHYLKGDFNKSITHLNEAQKLNPNRAATSYYMGKTYHEDGAIDNALSAFRESLHLDPNRADASFQVGKILIDQLEGV